MGFSLAPAADGSYTSLLHNGSEKLRVSSDGTVEALTGPLKLAGETVQRVKQLAAKATTSGTLVDFSPADGTGIPSWAKEIVISLHNFGTSAAAGFPIVQLGTSGGVQNTGYLGTGAGTAGSSASAPVPYTAGFDVGSSSGNWASTFRISGQVVLTLLDPVTGTWACSGLAANSAAGTGFIYYFAGSKQLSGVLDRLRLATADGSSTLSAGMVSVLVKG